jgi:hypothetical protein
VGKQFILQPNEAGGDGGNVLCEISGARMSKAEGTNYQVQIEGTSPTEMSAREMVGVFKDSFLLEAEALKTEESGMIDISHVLN